MAFKVYWDSHEQGQLVLELSETVTWEEFMAGVREAHALALIARQTVTLVVWARASFPDGLALWRLSAVFRGQPANIEQIMIVVEERSSMLAFAKSLAGIIQRLYPEKSRIRFADTIEEARMLSTPADALTQLE